MKKFKFVVTFIVAVVATLVTMAFAKAQGPSLPPVKVGVSAPGGGQGQVNVSSGGPPWLVPDPQGTITATGMMEVPSGGWKFGGSYFEGWVNQPSGFTVTKMVADGFLATQLEPRRVAIWGSRDEETALRTLSAVYDGHVMADTEFRITTRFPCVAWETYPCQIAFTSFETLVPRKDVRGKWHRQSAVGVLGWDDLIWDAIAPIKSPKIGIDRSLTPWGATPQQRWETKGRALLDPRPEWGRVTLFGDPLSDEVGVRAEVWIPALERYFQPPPGTPVLLEIEGGVFAEGATTMTLKSWGGPWWDYHGTIPIRRSKDTTVTITATTWLPFTTTVKLEIPPARRVYLPLVEK